MSKTLLIGGLAALTLTAAGGAALAQQAPRADAQVSRADFVERRVARLTAADADRNGQVSAEEMKAAREARTAQRRDARFDRLDADKDGVLSRAEFEARPERAGQRGPRARGPQRAAFRAERRAARTPVVIADAQARAEQAFARLDADRDGAVTRAERQAVRAERRTRLTERRAARTPQASPSTPASE